MLELKPSQMETVCHQFDSLCRKILREESRDYRKHIAWRARNEVCFSEMPESRLAEICCWDAYPAESTHFDVLGYRIEVSNEELAGALKMLSDKKRDVVLLSFFMEMSDREIAAMLNVVGSTIQRRRTSSLAELKWRLGVGETEQNTEQGTQGKT